MPGSPVPVLFCIPYLGSGGAERQLTVLLQQLDRTRVQPHLAVFHKGGALDAEILDIPDVTLHQLAPGDEWKKRHLFLAQWRLILLARRVGAKVVFSQLPLVNTMALVAGLATRARSVWSIRASNIPWRAYGRGLQAVFRWEAWLSRWAGMIIANSQAGADHYQAHGYAAGNMRVIRNGVDCQRFRPDAAAGVAMRARLGIPEGAQVVGQVGRLDPQKDYATFLQAVAVLCESRPSMHILCTGRLEGAYADEMQALGQQLGLGDRLHWTGEVSEMPALYNALDVLVLASSYGEGVPNAVGEAMACGVPCVATDVGDSAWLLAEVGATVPPGDAAALAAEVLSVLSCEDKNHLSESIRRRAQAKLSLERMVEEVTVAIESLSTAKD